MKSIKMVSVVLCLILLASAAIAEYVPFAAKLNMLERFVAQSLLPKETNFSNWKIINDLKNQLAPTEAELKALEIKADANGGVSGKWDAVPEKEIVFGEITEKIIVDALKELDKHSKLLPEHISLYKKFVLREK